MGKQNFPPKRNNVKRKKKPRPCKKYILIVTEGTKTEPNYFKGLRKDYRLSGISIEILPGQFGSNPLDVINFAIHLQSENARLAKKQGEPKYDKIYCVIDRDEHEHFEDAMQRGLSKNLTIIRSIPCFEIWYLLHFKYTTKPYDNRKVLFSELKNILGEYEKNSDLYDKIKERTSNGITNSESLFTFQSNICDIEKNHPNPFTEVHFLVKDITKNQDI